MNNTRIAQTFRVNGLYTPKKVSIKALINFYNVNNYFDFRDLDLLAIDASNFYSVEPGSIVTGPRVIFDDSPFSTGGGSIGYSSSESNRSDYPKYKYPIYLNTGQTIYFSYLLKPIEGQSSANYKLRLIINNSLISDTDGSLASSVLDVIDSPTSFTASSSGIHWLEIISSTANCLLDKIFVKSSNITPDFDTEYSQSPYLTLLMNINEFASSEPVDPAKGIIGYHVVTNKDSSEENIDFIMNFHDPSDDTSFNDEFYTLCLSVGGSLDDNSVLWQSSTDKDDELLSLYK